MTPEELNQFQSIFFPRSVAVVGASRDETKSGTNYFRALLKAGFPGPVYPVHNIDPEVLGHKAYPRLSDIPGPVDYVIVCVPSRFVLEILDDCVVKGVKVVQFFTAGFRETGTAEGRQLEEEMLKRARQGGFRIIGPNCIGVYSPAHRMPYGMTSLVGPVGPVSFLSQSGGHGNRIVEAGTLRGLRFSKLVSFGNGCDLDSVDYFEYLAQDSQTGIIGAYLEGVRKDGRHFFGLIREIARTKPLVLWKGGRTEAGAQTASSHTGSLAISYAVWSAALKQIGAVRVESLEEMVDTLLAFQQLGPCRARRVVVLAGLSGGGGGESVSSSDACVTAGLEVPPFSETLRRDLNQNLPPAGTILRNPLDMGSSGGHLDALNRVLELLLREPGLDMLIINEHVEGLVRANSYDTVLALNDLFIEWRRRQPKPLVMVLPPSRAFTEQREIEGKLTAGGLPVYPSLDRAAKAVANVSWYWRNREERELG